MENPCKIRQSTRKNRPKYTDFPSSQRRHRFSQFHPSARENTNLKKEVKTNGFNRTSLALVEVKDEAIELEDKNHSTDSEEIDK